MKTKLTLSITALILLAIIISACTPTIPQPSQPVLATEVPQPAATEAQSPTLAPAEMPTDGPTGAIVLPDVDAASLSGEIYSAGSSTVYPLSEQLVLMFSDQGFSGEHKLDSIGSGAGFERFCKTGETDIANASREDQRL